MASFVRIALAGAGSFAKIEIRAGDDISDLVERACVKFPSWKADSAQLSLYLAAAGGDDIPTPSAIDSARHLGERALLSDSMRRIGSSMKVLFGSSMWQCAPMKGLCGSARRRRAAAVTSPSAMVLALIALLGSSPVTVTVRVTVTGLSVTVTRR